MSWLKHHSQSEGFASQAEAALRKGDVPMACELYKLAALEEELALSKVDQNKKRTFGITAVSAASLYFKGEDFLKAEKIAHKYLASDELPSFAVNQFQSILQKIWNEKLFREAGVEFVKGEVLVSVGGGIVVHGGAPLDLIHRKIDEVRNIFFRVIEMLLNRPFRKHGGPSLDIQDQFRPWLLQTIPGSYQFAVRVQKPAQLRLFPDGTPVAEEVTQKFLEVVEATAKETHQELEKIVTDPDYRESFLKLTRNLAPTGKSFNRLEIKSATDLEAPPIVFLPESRKAINTTIKLSKKHIDDQLKEEQLTGILRGLHLDKNWIEINIPEEEKLIRVFQTGDMIDDIVGPMVNHRVIVDVAIKSDGKYIFRDIQSYE